MFSCWKQKAVRELALSSCAEFADLGRNNLIAGHACHFAGTHTYAHPCSNIFSGFMLKMVTDVTAWHGQSWHPLFSQISLKGLFGSRAKVTHFMAGVHWDKFPALFAASIAPEWLDCQACITRLARLDHHLLARVPLMSIYDNRSLGSRVCTRNQNYVVFHHISGHKIRWVTHTYLTDL